MEKLYTVISDALQKPISSITSDKRIFIDFQIESVEALELEFAIEEAFEIKIEPTDIWKLPSYLINNNMVNDGNLTQEAYSAISKSFPDFDQETITSIKQPSDIYKHIRVLDLYTYITNKMQGEAA